MVPISHTAKNIDISFRASAPRLWNELASHIKLEQVEKYFVRFLKPIYLNWRIYNIKPVYYV